MSSLGFQLVYALLNEQETLVCERFFLPENDEALLSMESGRELSQFPLVFISISFEHDYLHLVEILLRGGIAPLAKDRNRQVSARSPLVICGGVATFMNPEPLAPFVDLFLIGEAEPLLENVTNYLLRTYAASERLKILTGVSELYQGCYAPSLYTLEYGDDGRPSGHTASGGQLPGRIKKVFQESCSKAAHSQLLSPGAEFSDLFLTELGRGCSRGCRFCAAGYIYRPPRLWSGDAVAAGIAERWEGVDRVGLVGMEMADAAELDTLSAYLGESGCALSFSSLRADRLSAPLLDLLAASNLKSVAIAPDGCSERLRKVINKGLDEQDLICAAERLVAAGIYKLKLYL
ncbi:MAG: radical SAM protein, partial [Deltaproteobacteria bacterium]|nr:radical SAM protein [Deltaproteobacteria bacterium]